MTTGSQEQSSLRKPELPAPPLQVLEATVAAGTLLDAPQAQPSGRKWRVRIFEYGLSKNRYPAPNGRAAQESEAAPLSEAAAGPDLACAESPLGASAGVQSVLAPLNWTERAARSAVRVLEGVKCFADHIREGNGRSVRDLIGFFSEATVSERGLEATLTLLESEGWARTKLLAARQAGRIDLIGFSIDAVIGVRPCGAGPQRVLEVEEVVAINSVDMVSAASSGGRALEVLEGRDAEGVRARSAPAAQEVAGAQASGAEREREQPPPALRRLPHGQTAAGGAAFSVALKEGEHMHNNPTGSIQTGQGRSAQGGEAALAGPEGAAELHAVSEQVQALRGQIADAVCRQRAAENRMRLHSRLAASRLPKPLADLVASRFQNEIATPSVLSAREWANEIASSNASFGGREIPYELKEEEIEMEIQRVREAYAALSPVGRVMETGRVQVVREPEEKMQIALDRLFGLPVEDASIPAFHGIREAYVAYTGDGEVTGTLPSEVRVREDITTSTFPNALANTLRRLLLKEYREQDYGISLIAQFASVPDFRTQERVRVGYFGDLPTVATETADYTELSAPTDEKASYSVVTFGGIVTITRKMILNDDLGVVPAIVSRLGRSARRTLAQRVFNLMITNPAIYDGVAWFHATHGNLGTNPLSATELDAVRTAMRNRTEKDSGKKLGIAPYVLVVPHELEGKARQENMREYLDASFTPNPVRFLFGANGERIIVSPLLTDTNDWYVFANVQEAPTVEVGFLQGQQEPAFFLSDSPGYDKVFSSDKIRYKVRHEFEAAVIDFRGAYKEAVVGG